MCDVVCTGRFYDFFEKRGRWGLVLRQPIYEKDRLDPLDPSAKLALDQDLLARFPEGYRHLAYLQTRIGYTVKRDMPGLDGPEVEALYARGERWLGGGAALIPPPEGRAASREGWPHPSARFARVHRSSLAGRDLARTLSINFANAASCSLIMSRVV